MSDSTSKTSTVAQLNDNPEGRRKDLRIPGPFDGCWVGALSVPVTIHDLSLGGCLIQAYHEQAPGRQFTLEIHLPYYGWVSVEAESVYVREGYGFAAKFVDMSDEAHSNLEEVIWRLAAKSPSRL